MKCKQKCHFHVEAFTTCPYFHTLFPLSQSNQALFLSLSLARSVSCSYSFSLSLSHTHTCITYVSFYISAFFFLLTYPLLYGPALPASGKWQPWAPSLYDQISRKRNWLPKLATSFHPWIIQLCLGAQHHMWSRPLTLYYRQGNKHSEMMEISSAPVKFSRLLNKK